MLNWGSSYVDKLYFQVSEQSHIVSLSQDKHPEERHQPHCKIQHDDILLEIPNGTAKL